MDLLLVENGNGGDVLKKAKDLSVIEGLQNMPYLAMFGGNFEASTKTSRLASEQDFSWWGNNVLFPNESELQFNSETERALMNTALTSAGREIIEQAVISDLKFMKSFCKVAVAVAIVATDRVAIGVKLVQPDSLQSQQQIFIWDATLNELNLQEPSPSGVSNFNNVFDYTLDFEFI